MAIGCYLYIIKIHFNSLFRLFCDVKNRLEFSQLINDEKISMIIMVINDNEIFFDAKEISKEKDG